MYEILWLKGHWPSKGGCPGAVTAPDLLVGSHALDTYIW